MFFTKNNARPPNVDIIIRGEKINIVTEFRHLGTITDLNLTFLETCCKNCKKKTLNPTKNKF